MYYKDNRLISKNDIPEDASVMDMDFVMPAETIDASHSDNAVLEVEATSEPEVTKKVCAICGNDPEYQKFVNGTIHFLCADHYLNLTTGEIVQAIRESNGN